MSGRSFSSPPAGSGPGTARAGEEEAALATREDPLLLGFGERRSVLVAGASGFLGRHLVRRLVSRGHEVRGLGRGAALPGPLVGTGIEWRRGDVTRAGGVTGAAAGCDVLVHLVGVRSERAGPSYRSVHVDGTRRLLDEARRAGIARVVYVSALGARAGGGAFYHSKFEAERLVEEAALPGAVVRPAAVFGPEDHFTEPAVRWLRSFPILPVPASRGVRLRPASVEDVTDALCQTVERDELDGTYAIAGPEPLEFVEAVREVARVLGVRTPVVPVPDRVTEWVLRAGERLGLDPEAAFEGWRLLVRRPPVHVRGDELRRIFQIEPLPFREALADYLGTA